MQSFHQVSLPTAKMNNTWLFLNYFALFAVSWNKTFVADTASTEVKMYFMHIVYSYIKKFKNAYKLV